MVSKLPINVRIWKNHSSPLLSLRHPTRNGIRNFLAPSFNFSRWRMRTKLYKWPTLVPMDWEALSSVLQEENGFQIESEVELALWTLYPFLTICTRLEVWPKVVSEDSVKIRVTFSLPTSKLISKIEHDQNNSNNNIQIWEISYREILFQDKSMHLFPLYPIPNLLRSWISQLLLSKFKRIEH